MTSQARAPSSLDVAALEAALRRRVDAEVRFDHGSRGAYATDASNYRQPPLGVVVPRSIDAAVEAVGVCRELGAPVLSRGGGTSLGGQGTNAAVVLDWSKYCHRLTRVDADQRTCVVEPGIVLDVLNEQLSEVGLMFGPKPATHQQCSLGGMVGNNSCGATAQAYGKTADNVRRLEVLTYDGLRMWVGPTSDPEFADITKAAGRRAQIYQDLGDLRDRYLGAVRTGFPDIPRRVSGYNLDALLPENGFDLAKALVGSEGTLVVVLRAELDLVPVPPHRALVVLGYHDIAAAADAVPRIVEHAPHQLEGVDDVLVGLERGRHLHPDAIEQLPEGAGWLFVEFVGDSQDEADRRGHDLVDQLRADGPELHAAYFDDPVRQAELIELRESGLGASAHPPGQRDTWEGWEDAAVPPYRLGDYLRDFRKLLDEFAFGGLSPTYGHFGHGCVHTRIPFELRTADGVAQFRRFVESAADLVASYGGSFSGEHGDGQARGELLERMFGKELVTAFEELKAVFDPNNRLNPGKVVHPNRLDANLRLGADVKTQQGPTAFVYPDDEGSFSKAVMRCVGVGKCRNHGTGVMCPSYQVTKEEEHSTRGRARLLFEMIREGPDSPIQDGWRSTAVRDALDLCLACKGCKSDCPVGVDMATYKAEFLQQHYAGRLRPRAHYSMGWLPAMAAAATKAPRAVNALAQAPGLGPVAKYVAGVARQRTLPLFAERSFADWFARQEPQTRGAGATVVLWPDTFTNYFHPGIGKAAVQVLAAAGFNVKVPRQTLCCGLTWISTGQVSVARRVLRRTIDALADDLRAGALVLGLEPSCTAVLRSDVAELFPHDEDVRRLRMQTRTLAELLTQDAGGWRPPRNLDGRPAVLQTHCHQHAVLGGSDADVRVLRQVGVDVRPLAPSCCGLAGDFGFEDGHYEVSRAVGEQVLLPAVRDLDPATVVVADGFSCRTQVEQGDTGRRAVHLAEVLAAAVDDRRLAPAATPEAALAERPEPPRDRDRWTATAAAGGALVGATAGAGRLARWLSR